MPRLAPQFDINGGPCVIEHRLTLGTMERTQLKLIAQSYSRSKWLENIPQMVGLGFLGGGIYWGFKYGGAAIGAGLDLAKDAGEFIEDTYSDLNNGIRGLNPDGTPKTVTTTNLGGEETEIDVPFTGTFLGGAANLFTELVVWLPNPLTGQVPGTIPWIYRKTAEAR